MTDPNDPLAQLDAWGRKVERKTRRGLRRRALRLALRPGRSAIAAAIVAVFLTALTIVVENGRLR